MERLMVGNLTNETGFDAITWNDTTVTNLKNKIWINDSTSLWNTSAVSTTCEVWEVAQHNLFQTANMFMAAAFIVPKNFKQNILLVRALLCVGFLLNAIWGGFSLCGPDVFGWNIILCLINLGHTISLTMKFLPPRLNVELTELYLKQFKPFRVDKKHFKELAKEAQILKLEVGETYAVEDVTPADEKLSILLRGKLNVTCDDAHLHYIHPHQFIDSPEWEAFHEWSADIFQVTIEAQEECLYLCWPRLRLERVLRHRTVLRQVFESMIGKDITHKLYALNEHLGGLKMSKTEKFNTACRKSLNRSLSFDAVFTGRNGNVRSDFWRTKQEVTDEKNYPCSTPSPVKSRHAHLYIPIRASHFSPDYPFPKQNVQSQNGKGSGQKSQSGSTVTDSEHLDVPPASGVRWLSFR
ncbi:hypothetical protein RUM44_013222 [Polyplax serrata]|uniref:POPDC1-3 domain-containing protein n=1 Tax=Polyplax serrata TaxID=468196 RepID=A0ABR1BHW3_POLSC